MAEICSSDFTHTFGDDSIDRPERNLVLLPSKTFILVLGVFIGYLPESEFESGAVRPSPNFSKKVFLHSRA